MIEKTSNKTRIDHAMSCDMAFASGYEDSILDILPTGSGLDCDYTVLIHKNKNITVKTNFHAMDQNGYYDGYMLVTIRFFRDLEGKIDFNLKCNENRKASFYGLKEYLSDLFYTWLND